MHEYIYLGQLISLSASRHHDEINRRINITWSKFRSNKDILKSNMPVTLKKKVLDSCLLLCLTYGCQTWIYDHYTKNKIQGCQRAFERSILNIKRKDRIRNVNIRKSTNVIDALEHCKRLKWKWAGHIPRMNNKKWTYKITTWDMVLLVKGRGVDQSNAGATRSAKRLVQTGLKRQKIEKDGEIWRRPLLAERSLIPTLILILIPNEA